MGNPIDSNKQHTRVRTLCPYELEKNNLTNKSFNISNLSGLYQSFDFLQTTRCISNKLVVIRNFKSKIIDFPMMILNKAIKFIKL